MPEVVLESLREICRWSHVIAGFLGLTAFWFPVFAKKGGTLHRRAGTVFVFAGYWVTASAALSCALIGWKIWSQGLAAQNPEALASIVFLAYLAWVTFVMLRYSVGVLETKKDPTLLDTPGYRFLALSALASSALLAVFATVFSTSWSLLLYALSPIGLGIGLPMLRYMRGDVSSPREWFYEHMRATLSAGIAFHTAFAVFGASRLFTLPESGVLSILPWVLPAAVGTPGLALWTRHYRRRFGDLSLRARPVAVTAAD